MRHLLDKHIPVVSGHILGVLENIGVKPFMGGTP